jgi:cytochrome c biogenesis protein CcdA
MPSSAATDVPFALAFGAGLVASINPCGFALLPSLIAYYLGSEASVPSRSALGRIADGLLVGLVVTAGFLAVFTTMGATVALGVQPVVRATPWVTMVIGIALVGLGAWLLAGKAISVHLPGITVNTGSGYRSLFVFGIAYALGSLSCTLPVFMLVVSSGLAAGSALGSVSVFLAYGLGMATVLTLLCLGTAGFRELLVRRIRRVYPFLNRISGTLLVIGGAYVIYYWISLLRGNSQGGAIRAFEDLQGVLQRLVAQIGNQAWFLLGVVLVGAALVSLAIRLMRQPEPKEAEMAATERWDRWDVVNSAEER